MQEYLDSMVKGARKNRLSSSDQLTLGEVLEKLEPIVKNQKYVIGKYKEEANVMFDFEYFFPTDISSWRGAYDELALNIKTYEGETKPLTITQFYNLLKDCIGKEFYGYKGGDYVMDIDTPIWVANYGNSGNTAVIDIVDNEYSIIIITGYREY